MNGIAALKAQQVRARLKCLHCENPSVARNLCSGHYQRERRHGDPLAGKTGRGVVRAWVLNALKIETDKCLLFPFAKSGGRPVMNEPGTRRFIGVARFILVRHTGIDPPELEVAHNCGVGDCCNKRHLRWATHAENMADTVTHGTSTREWANAQTILSKDDVRLIRERRADGTPVRRLADTFGVSKSTIWSILYRHNWGWLL